MGIPTAIQKIVASHITITLKDQFSYHLIPYNYAVGINGGMDFIFKAMNLSIKHHIIIRQQNSELPTHAGVFIDLTNMFI